MNRSIRRALNLFAAASALLFVTTCVMWATSYSAHIEQLSGRYPVGEYAILSYYSNLRIDLRPDPPARPAAHRVRGETIDRASLPGFQWKEYRTRYSNGNSTWTDFEGLTVEVAYWLLALVFLLAPAAVVTAALRRSRRGRSRLAARLCDVCGYDLRATPSRCPECGAVPFQGRPAASGRKIPT